VVGVVMGGGERGGGVTASKRQLVMGGCEGGEM